MASLRAFIAIEISPSIQQAIQASLANLRRALGPKLVKWIPSENLHLTIKFLGDISPTGVTKLTDMLTAEAARSESFSIHVHGLGSFPNPKRARVIWIGLDAPASLTSLASGIEAACVRLGYDAEARPFSPHLTVGRVKEPLSADARRAVTAALEQTQVGDLGMAIIDSVHLFKSDLKPTGAEYTRLFSALLKTN